MTIADQFAAAANAPGATDQEKTLALLAFITCETLSGRPPSLTPLQFSAAWMAVHNVAASLDAAKDLKNQTKNTNATPSQEHG